MKKPLLSIVLPTYNAEGDLRRFFKSFNRQTIRKDAFELLVLDGGSTDETVSIARKNGATVIHNPYKLTEPGVALGFQKAMGDLVMVLAADNLFRDPDAIEQMIAVFRDKSIAGAFPKHDTGPGDNWYSWYINTFTDPFTHFVYGDAANTRTFHRIYKTLTHTGAYDVYDYTSSAVRPIIALAQGFTIRKKFLPARHEISDDILSIYNMIDEHKRMAYVHSVTLYHYTIRDTKQFVSKLRRGVDNALLRADSGITKRRVYMTPGQRIRMVLFFPYAFSLILPLLQSIISAVRFREPAWLIHWIMVFFSAAVITIRACSLSVRRIVRGN